MGDVSTGSVQRSMTPTLREFVQQNRAVPTGADYTVSLDSHDLK